MKTQNIILKFEENEEKKRTLGGNESFFFPFTFRVNSNFTVLFFSFSLLRSLLFFSKQRARYIGKFKASRHNQLTHSECLR